MLLPTLLKRYGHSLRICHYYVTVVTQMNLTPALNCDHCAAVAKLTWNAVGIKTDPANNIPSRFYS